MPSPIIRDNSYPTAIWCYSSHHSERYVIVEGSTGLSKVRNKIIGTYSTLKSEL